jgi:glycosyltransferase involved in cell wall biosynthesis
MPLADNDKQGMAETPKQPKVLLISNDVVGSRMAGPGIRYWEFARALSSSFDVTLAIPPFLGIHEISSQPDFPARVLACHHAADLRALADAADVIVTLGIIPSLYPFLTHSVKPLVIDLFDPFLLSSLQQSGAVDQTEQVTRNQDLRRTLYAQLRAGDYFICASERQRDYCLGMLSASGRVNPYTHADDASLRRLIDVVPFGLPAEPPRHTHQVLKGAYPPAKTGGYRKTIADGDKVVLWGGGIWDWFDASTLIRAMALLAGRREDIKLFFMGVERANARTPAMEASRQAVVLSQKLGLHDRTVFFNDWVPYDERQNYLLEADVGVSLHRNHVETRLAFRTRFLDYLWAGLPIVATQGDVLADLVQEWELGRIVAPGDAEAVAAALLELLDTPALRERYRARFARAAAGYRWEVVTAPLADFCAHPRLAPDKAYLRTAFPDGTSETPWQSVAGRAWRALRTRGLAGLLHDARAYLRWRRGQ